MLDESNRLVIAKQLKREHVTEAEVIYRCAADFPVVIENPRATDEGRPFPTLYWLTCPRLQLDISRLEAGGLISEFQRELANDAVMREELHESDAHYRARRDGEAGSDVPMPGIAGCRDVLNVKCLHAHAADWLATGMNPVGRRIAALCPLPTDCDSCQEL